MNLWKDFQKENVERLDKDDQIRRTQICFKVVIILYMIAMLIVYPLYLKDGYYYIVSHKLALYKLCESI